MASSPPPEKTPELGLREELVLFKNWCLANPVSALLMATLLGTCICFFAVPKLFVNGSLTAAKWASQAWVGDQEYSWLVPPISLFLFWLHKEELRKAPKAGSNRGLIYFGLGILLFVLSARCVQPRMALFAIPFLVFGAIYYLWGAKVARIVLFPCAFLIFMIPSAVVDQATASLQFIITGAVGFLAKLIGLHIDATGTYLKAADGSFNFEVAQGCSGIRSLTAMTMLTAVFAHLTQDRIWKMVVVLSGSVVFAIIGNVGRIFTVVLVARFYDPVFAGGKFHDISGYISFPFALAAMIGFSKLVNMDFRKLTTPEPAKNPEGASGAKGQSGEAKVKTYDY
jgi:exosortase